MFGKRKETGMKNKKILLIVIVSVVVFVGILFFGVVKLGPAFNLYLFPPSTQQYVDSALKFMDNGIYAEGDAWKEAKEKARSSAKEVKDYNEAHDILNEALKVAGGKHSGLYVEDDTTTDEQQTEMPAIELDDDQILYLKVTATEINTPKEYYNSVIDFVKKNQSDIKGVIIDLRDNVGGDMGPMLATVSPFLEDGTVLEFRMRTRKTAVTINKGKIKGGGTPVVTEDIKVKNIPIAILQNNDTASSGEAILLSFRGLDNVKTFGEASAGYCSCNGIRYLYDGAMMALTIASDVARTGEEFCEDPIEPDVETSVPLEDAKEWVLQRMER